MSNANTNKNTNSEKREDIEKTEAIAVTDSKKGAGVSRESSGSVDPQKKIDEINAKFPALPIEVIKSQTTNDIFKVNLPEPYNKMFVWSWPSKDGQDLGECLSMGYFVDLPKEVYDANRGAGDTPFAISREQGNRIIRGDNVLALCRVEDFKKRHEIRQQKIKDKYAPFKNKEIGNNMSTTFGDSKKRDMRAEMAMREAAASRLMEQEARKK